MLRVGQPRAAQERALALQATPVRQLHAAATKAAVSQPMIGA
ncbi:hypothetical protein XVE_0973 [Xanthomonas vesicatoria ATCC 35937]|uniref:Uncharacterized protein n=1 Tax=Xanthomonas vesicatoria ATCC 35937 TaxID=925775 RepID=F0BA27_9XANT|nr:hypothetical protein XVE_0973 [Xanthomonas vesicatoria ATCC 35937]